MAGIWFFTWLGFTWVTMWPWFFWRFFTRFDLK